MKRLLFILVISVIYAACTSTTTASNESVAASSLSMPYTAAYSSNFSLGKDSNTLAVLNNYKAWEIGDMTAFKNTIGDSLTMYFSSGYKFSGTRDSATYYASQY